MTSVVNKLRRKSITKEQEILIPDIDQLEMFEVKAVKRAAKEKDVFLTAINEVAIREHPYQPLTNFVLDRKSIDTLGKRAEYLLVGFDTEYQPLKTVFTDQDVKDGAAKYEVLSYQFYAIEKNGSSWSGIAIPDPNQRLTFTEFLIYVLAAGADRGITIPRNIVLVGHYNRADIPAFADRDQVYDRVRNVRNSLVTQSVPITVKITFSEQPIDLKVYLRDTMLLAPAGSKSLAAVGELVGIPKMKLHETPEGDLKLKRMMKYVRANKPELFREYAILDAKISALYFKEVTRIYQEATGAEFVPSLLSNIGVKILQDEWRSRSDD